MDEDIITYIATRESSHWGLGRNHVKVKQQQQLLR